jgi:antitoxin component YwqK of YwqJK toxin-antitoxin module
MNNIISIITLLLISNIFLLGQTKRVSYYGNGLKKLEEQLVNGRREGTTTEWYVFGNGYGSVGNHLGDDNPHSQK